MWTHSERKMAPYSATQLYDLVADIAAYPEFLPWCKKARIISQSTDEVIADLMVGTAFIQETYRSKVTLTPLKGIGSTGHIRAESIQGLFTHLHNDWSFTAVSETETEITLELHFSLRSPLLEKVLGSMFHHAQKKLLHAFEKRAAQLYGREGQS